jgi:hypothetical protein
MLRVELALELVAAIPSVPGMTRGAAVFGADPFFGMPAGVGAVDSADAVGAL